MRKKIKYIAHRGDSMLHTENSIDAFLSAINKDFYGIECDVHITKDSEFVIFHDDTTKRLTEVDYKIKDLTLNEIKRLKLYNIQTKKYDLISQIPSFEEYLKICIINNKKAIIELKTDFSNVMIKNLFKIIDKYNYINNVVIISFDFNNLLRVREYKKEVKIQYLITEFNKGLIEKLVLNKFDVNCLHNILNKNILCKFHENNILVNTWTVNQDKDLERVINLGVDFITTDGNLSKK